MTQKTIDWPANVRAGAQEWWVQQPTADAASPFSGSITQTLIGPPRWAFSMDLPDAPAAEVPRREALLRKLRNGLNLLRIGDQRRSGRGALVPGGGRRALNLLPWAGQLLRWRRVGEAPAASAGEELTVNRTSNYYTQTAETLIVGLVYVLVAEVSSLVSAQVALALASGPAGEQLGVVFDAQTGAEVSRYGPVLAAGAVSGGGRWRVWLTLRCVRQGQALVQLYALLPAHGLWQMTLRRPVVGMAVGPIPPAFVSTTEGAAWADLSVVVDGAGQTGDMLQTAGWPTGVTLTAGHWISWGDGMRMVLDDAVVDADGRAALWIEPPIWATRPPADQAPVAVRAVTGRFKLLEGARVRQEGMVLKGSTLNFLEEL